MPNNEKQEREAFLEIHVRFTPGDITALRGGSGEEVLMIPFGGTASGSVFNGEVCPGAADVQTVNAVGVRHMFARYMLRGTDSAGKACMLYVENNGWFVDGPGPGQRFDTVPTFCTDSAALAGFLHRRSFVGEGVPGPEGLVIRFYEA